MSGNDRQDHQDVQETSVKVEPREFCTESTGKVFKLTVTKFNGNDGSTTNTSQEKNGTDGHDDGGDSHISIVCDTTAGKNILDTTQSQSSPVPVAVLNNDACKLMDFCTNMRVDANLGLKEGPMMSDSDSDNMSDDTEYESAEQMAEGGAPVPTLKSSGSFVCAAKPKTPGARWSRNTYKSRSRNRGGLGPPACPVPVEKKQLKNPASATTATATATCTATSPAVVTNSTLDISPTIKFQKILPKPSSTLVLSSSTTDPTTESESLVTNISPGSQLMQFCTNMKVDSDAQMPENQNQAAAAVPATCTSTTTSVVISANPPLLHGTRNFNCLPRPPNKFQYHWMNVYHWLEYDTEKHSMFCNMCKKLKKTNPFAVYRGCTNFKTCTLKRHEESKEHKEAILHYAMNNQAMVVQRPTGTSIINKNAAPPSQIVGADNKVIGVVSHSSLASLSTKPVPVTSTNVQQDQRGVKRNAQSTILLKRMVEPKPAPPIVEGVMSKEIAGIQYKIVPQTITTLNSGGAPVMIHKLVPTTKQNQAAEQQQERNYTGFRMAYYVAKEQLPIGSTENLIALVNYPPFHSWKNAIREQIYCDMHRCIATAIQEVIHFQLPRANYLTLILEDGGEVTPGGCERWLIVHAKYVYHNKLRSYFFHLGKLHETSADEVVTVLCELLLKCRISFQRLVGLELKSDKDGVLTHVLPQVVCELSRQGCKFVSVHTSGSPQLAASVSEVGRCIPALQRYESVIGMLFDYFESATNHTVEIPLLQEHLEEQTQGIVNLRTMQWLSHAGTVKVIFLVWPALVEALNAEEDEEAQDLFKVIKQYTFIALTHFFMDFLPSIQALDELLQQEPWNSTAVHSAAELAIASLEALQDHLGVHERHFFEQFDETTGCFSSVTLLNYQSQQQEVADVRNEFLRIFLIELRGRFPEGFDSKAKDAFHILNPKVLCEIKDINTLGLPQMSVIFKHLGFYKGCEEEFKWVVDRVTKQFATSTIEELCCGLLTICDTPSYVTYMMKVLECLRILPGFHTCTSSSQQQAGKSLAALLKMDLGEGVTRENRMVNRLCILLNGPPIDKFDYEKAYMQWIDMHPKGVSDNELHWKLNMSKK